MAYRRMRIGEGNWLVNDEGQLIGMVTTGNEEVLWPIFNSDATALVGPDGSVYANTEVSPVVTITATGTAHTGTGLYGGVKFRAISGTVTLTIYDALSATGTPIHTITAASLTGGNGTGYYEWAGNKLLPLATGLHIVLSGGGSFTADVLVQ